jgi:hypothetical protein
MITYYDLLDVSHNDCVSLIYRVTYATYYSAPL